MHAPSTQRKRPLLPRGLTRGTAGWLAVISAVTPPHHRFGQSKARGRLRRRPLAIGGFRFLASRERWAVGRWDEWALFSCAVRNQQSREVTEALTLEPAQTSSFYPLDLAAAHQEPKPSTVEGRRRSHGTSHALPCQLPLLNWKAVKTKCVWLHLHMCPDHITQCASALCVNVAYVRGFQIAS
jgi:hypothetical protein